MPFIKPFAAAPAMLAALALTAQPAFAADLALPATPSAVGIAPAWSPAGDSAHDYRRYRHRRNGVDAGDVIAGVLILGGIAAVASAASKSQPRYPDRDWRYPDPRRGDGRYGSNDARGIDRAVAMCVEEIERDARVETVDNVARTARGWQVAGSLYDGQGFSCSIGEDGRIEAVDFGTGTSPYRAGYGNTEDFGYDGAGLDGDPAGLGDEGVENRQYGDDTYAAARARADAAMPAYPGGPLAGDEDLADGDLDYGTGYRGAGN